MSNTATALGKLDAVIEVLEKRGLRCPVRQHGFRSWVPSRMLWAMDAARGKAACKAVLAEIAHDMPPASDLGRRLTDREMIDHCTAYFVALRHLGLA